MEHGEQCAMICLVSTKLMLHAKSLGMLEPQGSMVAQFTVKVLEK